MLLARSSLEENASIVLFFGQIRPYKNIPELIRVFSRLQRTDARLLIVGGVSNDRLEREVREAASDERVLLRLGPIPDDQLHRYLAAATLVVLPYREILNSGSALARPDPRASATATGSGRHGRASVEGRPRLGAAVRAAALRRAARRGHRLGGTASHRRPDLRQFDPAAVVQAHMEAFADLFSAETAAAKPRQYPHRS